MGVISIQIKAALFFVIALFFGIHHSSDAQRRNNQLRYTGFFDSYYYEGPLNIVLGGGLSAYQGDLCNNLSCMGLQPYSFSAGANYNMYARLVFGAELQYNKLNGKGRFFDFDYAFNSVNWEFNAYTRFYLLYDVVRTSSDRLKHPRRFKPYVSLGASLLYYNYEFNREVTLVDSVIKQDDSPYYELEKRNYPAFGFAVPVGIGAEIRILPELSIVPELNYRFTMSDYLDDLPLKDNTYNLDGYYTLSLKIEITPWPKSARTLRRPRPKYKYDPQEEGEGDSSSSGGGGTETKDQEPDTDEGNDKEINEENDKETHEGDNEINENDTSEEDTEPSEESEDGW